MTSELLRTLGIDPDLPIGDRSVAIWHASAGLLNPLTPSRNLAEHIHQWDRVDTTLGNLGLPSVAILTLVEPMQESNISLNLAAAMTTSELLMHISLGPKEIAMLDVAVQDLLGKPVELPAELAELVPPITLLDRLKRLFHR